MDFLSFIKESSPKLNRILETEYQNYLNFQKPLEFLKVGHIYECNSIRYGGGGGRFIITAVAPFLKIGTNITKPEPIYHIISLNELDEYDPKEDDVHWETIDKIYEMVLTDVTDEYKDSDKIFKSYSGPELKVVNHYGVFLRDLKNTLIQDLVDTGL